LQWFVWPLGCTTQYSGPQLLSGRHFAAVCANATVPSAAADATIMAVAEREMWKVIGETPLLNRVNLF
jgi:hypothetical protein